MEKIDRLDNKIDDILKSVNETKTELAVFTVFFKNHNEKIEELRSKQKELEERINKQEEKIESLKDNIEKMKLESTVTLSTIKKTIIAVVFVVTTYVSIKFYM